MYKCREKLGRLRGSLEVPADQSGLEGFQWQGVHYDGWEAVPVLRKMQNPGSPNGPTMVDGWVVRLSSREIN